MSSALYRKYRPQTFAQMIGQNHIKITLQRELERGEMAHAYLFCGPRGLGKTTSARLFAKSVNCLNRKDGASEPCNECESCLEIMAGRSVDIIEIDAASNTGVDNVRENIIENSRFNPIKSKFKVFIIDEVHMLSTSAFNALLKILEEPPTHVIFILCTTEIHKLPVTIISRCQRFDFKKVTSEQLVKRLELVVKGEQKKVEAEVLKRIVLSSEGCVRDAESLLSKVLSLGDDISLEQAEIILPRTDFESIVNFVNYLSEKNSAAAIELINRLINDGFDLLVFTENLMEFLRQMLLLKASGGLEAYGLELSEEISKSLDSLTGKFSWDELLDLIEVFGEKGKEIKQSFIPQLPLEVAVIRVTQRIFCQKPDAFSFASKIAVTTAAPVKPAETAVKTENIQSREVLAVKPEVVSENPANQPAVANKEKTAENSAANYSSLPLPEIITKWQTVIQKLITSNFSLASVLRMSQPLKFENNVLEVAVTSLFYKGRLEANNNRPIIEQAFADELNTKVIVKGVVSSSVVPIEMNLEFNEETPNEPTTDSHVTNNIVTEVKKAIVAATPKMDVADEVMSMF